MRFLKLTLGNLFVYFLVSNPLRIEALQFSSKRERTEEKRGEEKGASNNKTLEHQIRIVPVPGG